MEYWSVKDIAKKWGLTERRVQLLCAENKVDGAKQIGRSWLIPVNAEKPLDGRTKSGKMAQESYAYHFPIFPFSPYFCMPEMLSEGERELFEAEMCYFEGDYAAGIEKCNNILSEYQLTHVRFGAYITICYCSMVLALYNEYSAAIKNADEILENEQLHKEDFRLIMSVWKHHIDWDGSRLLDLNAEAISEDGQDYYRYWLAAMTTVSSDEIPTRLVKIFESIYNCAIYDKRYPLAFVWNGILTIIYSKLKDRENVEKRIAITCDMALNFSWFCGYLCKISYDSQGLIKQYLMEKSPSASAAYQQGLLRNYKNIRLFVDMIKGRQMYKSFKTEDIDFVLLIGEGYSDKEIAKIKNVKTSEIVQKVEKLTEDLNLSSRAMLKKKILDETRVIK